MEIKEVSRSFGRKISLGNYEMLDLFCSMKAEIGEKDDPSEVSTTLYEMCKSEVMKEAKAIKDKLRGQNG